MNCPKCGNMVSQGTAFCPFCNEPLNTGFIQQNYQQGYGTYQQPSQGAPQQGGFDAYGNPLQQTGGYPPQQQPQQSQQVYQQSYVQYEQQNYPTGYQTPYVYGQQPEQHENLFLATLSELPKKFLESFTKPSEVLRTMIERKDMLTGIMVSVLALVLSFIAGMLVMRGFVKVLFTLASVITNTSMASNNAAMNQGINYIARQFGAPIGGIVALCQLISMLVPAAVAMVYLCVVSKVRFSWELLIGFSGVTTMPTVAATVIAMACSMISPWLAVLVCIGGMVISYIQMGQMAADVTGKSGSQMLPAKMICICVSILLVLLLNGVVGGILMSGTITRILTYI